MPTPIIEQSVFIEGNILTPTVGDTNYSVTVDNTIQNLANRTKWIKDNIVLTDTLGDYTLLTTTSSISGNLQSQINGKVSLNGDENISGVKTFSNNVIVSGDLTVTGSQFIVNTVAISAKDNQIVINAGEVGAGVTAGVAGIRVDRGSLVSYDFQFRESDDSFVIGISGEYQVVATRQDTPTNTGIAVWNASQNRFDTSTQLTSDNVTLLSTTASISGGLNTRVTNLETDLYTNTIVSLSGSSFSPDGLADIYSYALSGSATINAPSSIPNGQTIIFKLTQPVGGNATLTLADGSGLTWKKPGGSLTLTTTGNKEDILTVIRIGTNLYTSLVNNF